LKRGDVKKTETYQRRKGKEILPPVPEEGKTTRGKGKKQLLTWSPQEQRKKKKKA